MASPLIQVFVFQVILLLLESLGAQTVNDALYYVFKLISFAPTRTAGKDELRLRDELLQVKSQMKATSAQDDFARWARLRRQHDKLQEECKKYSSEQSSSRAKFDSRVNTIRFVVINGFRVYLQWNFTRVPMFWLPKGWIPWHGEWILAFPYAPLGSVSVQVWQMASGSVLAMIKDAITALVQLARGQASSVKGKNGQAQPRVSMKFAS